jgi:hypothetical protein
VLGPGSLRDNFGLPPSCSTNDLLALLGGKDGLGQLAFLPDFDRPLDAAERSSLTPAAVFILSVLAGLLNRSSMLVLDHAALARLDAGMRTRLLAVAAKRITLVAYRTEGVSEIGSHLESALVISTHNEILGWARVQSLISGDQAVRDAIARASGSRAPVEASLAVDEDPEDLA